MFSQDPRGLKNTSVLHDLGQFNETVGVGFIVDIDDTKIDLVLECHEIIRRRRVAIKAIECLSVEKPCPLVGEVASVFQAD